VPGPEAVSSFEPILRDLPAGVIVLRGPEHRIEFANELYYRLVGHRDLVGLTIREALPEIEGQGFFELLDRVYSTGEPYRGSEELVMLDRRGDGSLDEAFVNFVYVPTRGPDREVDGVFAHAVDVTELVRSRRQVEALARELDAERARLATIIEQMPAGVVIGEAPDGRLVLANRSWREFFGVSPEQVGDVGSTPRGAATRPASTRSPARFGPARSSSARRSSSSSRAAAAARSRSTRGRSTTQPVRSRRRSPRSSTRPTGGAPSGCSPRTAACSSSSPPARRSSTRSTASCG
jgi:PAS domain-containing protein